MNKEQTILNLKGLIVNGRIEDALTELLGFLKQLKRKDELLNEAILISSRYNKLQKEVRVGVISHGEETIAKNQINFAFLDLLNQVEKIETIESQKEDFKIQNTKNVISGSSISADGDIQIGDKTVHVGSGDNVSGDKK